MNDVWWFVWGFISFVCWLYYNNILERRNLYEMFLWPLFPIIVIVRLIMDECYNVKNRNKRKNKLYNHCKWG